MAHASTNCHRSKRPICASHIAMKGIGGITGNYWHGWLLLEKLGIWEIISYRCTTFGTGI